MRPLAYTLWCSAHAPFQVLLMKDTHTDTLVRVELGSSEASLIENLRDRFAHHPLERLKSDFFHQITHDLKAYIEEGRPLSLGAFLIDGVGTSFQQRVWRELSNLSMGETASYQTLARRIGAPQAVRAVGTACGANPWSLFIPCHRVVRTNGHLGGYAWGLPVKEWLLAHERRFLKAAAA
jgi:AraC family transcriptional regulator, regulatory protein of adaptative response / methylated-DNA-[protein]-cysteine methyltransferase